jgi:predicted small secreted protein
VLTDSRFLVGVVIGLALGYVIRHYQAQKAAQG